MQNAMNLTSSVTRQFYGLGKGKQLILSNTLKCIVDMKNVI